MSAKERIYKPKIFRRDACGDRHAQYVVDGKEWRYMNYKQKNRLYRVVDAFLDASIARLWSGE